MMASIVAMHDGDANFPFAALRDIKAFLGTRGGSLGAAVSLPARLANRSQATTTLCSTRTSTKR